MTRDESDLTRARLALLLTVVGMLDAMIERVSQKVHQRIADLVDDRTVEFGLLALDREVDVLVEFLGDVANHARETVEHLADGNHAHLHDDVLQVRRHAIHLLQSLRQFRHAVRRADLLKAHLVDDELANEVHEVVELLNVNAHGLARVMLLLCGRGLCCRLCCRFRRRLCRGLSRRRRRCRSGSCGLR